MEINLFKQETYYHMLEILIAYPRVVKIKTTKSKQCYSILAGYGYKPKL